MKSEHRRELHANELQRLAGHIGTFFEKHGRTVLIGLMTAVVVGVGLWFWLTRSGESVREGWAAVANVAARPAEERADAYAAIARRYQGTEVAPWARLLAAEAELQNGIRAAFTDREAAERSLESARENFELARDANGAPDNLRQRALYGLAVCLETTSGGDTSEAVAVYQQLLEEYPTTVYKKQAEERIQALQDDSAKEFYAFFREQHPRPEDPLVQPKDFARDRGPDFGLPPGHPPLGENPFAKPSALPKKPEPAGEGPLLTPDAGEGEPDDAKTAPSKDKARPEPKAGSGETDTDETPPAGKSKSAPKPATDQPESGSKPQSQPK